MQVARKMDQNQQSKPRLEEQGKIACANVSCLFMFVCIYRSPLVAQASLLLFQEL